MRYGIYYTPFTLGQGLISGTAYVVAADPLLPAFGILEANRPGPKRCFVGALVVFIVADIELGTWKGSPMHIRPRI